MAVFATLGSILGPFCPAQPIPVGPTRAPVLSSLELERLHAQLRHVATGDAAHSFLDQGVVHTQTDLTLAVRLINQAWGTVR